MAIAEESLISVSEANIIKPQNNRRVELEEDHYYTYNSGPVAPQSGISNLDSQNYERHQEKILDELSDDDEPEKE